MLKSQSIADFSRIIIDSLDGQTHYFGALFGRSALFVERKQFGLAVVQ
jgi:hypothetical protein